MNNIRDEHVSPDIPNPIGAFGVMTGMLLIGLVTATFGLWLMLPEAAHGSGFGVSKWLVLPIVIALTVFALKMIPGAVGQNLTRQYAIFKNKHTWAMTVIYIMTFGSFIGYSAALPLTIKVVFGFQHVEIDGVMNHDLLNPNGPSALMFAWMGPFIGARIRPIGGMMADKLGGARVTQWISFVMVGSALGLAWILQNAYSSSTPETLFIPFMILFLLLFAATGIGNGSTFRTIGTVFNKEQTGPVLGWTSAVAAYGAFIIPKVFGLQIQVGAPEHAIIGYS